mmetsp:Transcript_15977/g.41466  ORF Transcript_15977/g.41466 Transcript_15977/m.41466 type:complete len:226 (+) Transcript_15977:114-791(+)
MRLHHFTSACSQGDIDRHGDVDVHHACAAQHDALHLLLAVRVALRHAAVRVRHCLALARRRLDLLWRRVALGAGGCRGWLRRGDRGAAAIGRRQEGGRLLRGQRAHAAPVGRHARRKVDAGLPPAAAAGGAGRSGGLRRLGACRGVDCLCLRPRLARFQEGQSLTDHHRLVLPHKHVVDEARLGRAHIHGDLVCLDLGNDLILLHRLPHRLQHGADSALRDGVAH